MKTIIEGQILAVNQRKNKNTEQEYREIQILVKERDKFNVQSVQDYGLNSYDVKTVFKPDFNKEVELRAYNNNIYASVSENNGKGNNNGPANRSANI